MDSENIPRILLAQQLGIYRNKFYYKEKKKDKDWRLKIQIEEVLRTHPSYGSRRLAIHLKINRKRVKRVMNIFGIKAYRRHGKKWKKTKNIQVEYPNLLLFYISNQTESNLGHRFHLHQVSRKVDLCIYHYGFVH